jgi:uncharacterized protein YbgA (DUF1722 family)
MRVWDIHPGYLSNRSLSGEHGEIHALYSIISQKKSGYSRHPETLRWAEHLGFLLLRHDLVLKEMTLRGFNHNSPCPSVGSIEGKIDLVPYIDLPEVQFEILRKKYAQKYQKGRIPLPRNGSEFWSHHKYSVMSRGYQYYQDIQQFMKNRKDLPIEQEHDLIMMIQMYMEKQMTLKVLNNVVEHLWGYFNNKANLQEKTHFFNLPDSIKKLNYLFSMAEKYRQNYLLHSTVFADFLPCADAIGTL